MSKNKEIVQSLNNLIKDLDLNHIINANDISDSYHTFGELYEYRKTYNALLFNEWYKQGLYDVQKSKRHHDGKLCFGDGKWFIVTAILPSDQISNHYPIEDWDIFQVEENEISKHEYDGHTPNDVLSRMIDLLNERK